MRWTYLSYSIKKVNIKKINTITSAKLAVTVLLFSRRYFHCVCVSACVWVKAAFCMTYCCCCSLELLHSLSFSFSMVSLVGVRFVRKQNKKIENSIYLASAKYRKNSSIWWWCIFVVVVVVWWHFGLRFVWGLHKIKGVCCCLLSWFCFVLLSFLLGRIARVAFRLCLCRWEFVVVCLFVWWYWFVYLRILNISFEWIFVFCFLQFACLDKEIKTILLYYV